MANTCEHKSDLLEREQISRSTPRLAGMTINESSPDRANSGLRHCPERLRHGEACPAGARPQTDRPRRGNAAGARGGACAPQAYAGWCRGRESNRFEGSAEGDERPIAAGTRVHGRAYAVADARYHGA